jgi:large subunit ribosomal protein L19e
MGKQSRIANPQRRLAGSILKTGESNVWMDPAAAAKIGRAITRADVRRLIKEGSIRNGGERKPTPQRNARRQGIGSRKGAKGARNPAKESWLRIVRPQRALLSELKPKLQAKAYRKLYGLVKGGAFRSRAHITAYITDNKLIKETKGIAAGGRKE